MDLSSLPKFPNPETPKAAPRRVPSCRRTLPLRFLLVLAIWGGIYILREQVTGYTAAREKARAEELTEFMHTTGRWESLHGDGAILELKDCKFTLWSEGQVWLSGLYQKEGNTYYLWTWTWSVTHREDFPYRVRGEELEVELGYLGKGYFRHTGLPWNGTWRFKRLKD